MVTLLSPPCGKWEGWLYLMRAYEMLAKHGPVAFLNTSIVCSAWEMQNTTKFPQVRHQLTPNFPPSLRNEMKPSTGQRASDEVPFLRDDEKDIITSPRTNSWRVRWSYLLPYSGLLNIALVGILLGSWALRVSSTNKAGIPNEVYCKDTTSYYRWDNTALIL